MAFSSKHAAMCIYNSNKIIFGEAAFVDAEWFVSYDECVSLLSDNLVLASTSQREKKVEAERLDVSSVNVSAVNF